MSLIGELLQIVFKISWLAGVFVWFIGAYYMFKFQAAAGTFRVIVWFGSCSGFSEVARPYCRKCRKYTLIFMGLLAVMAASSLIGGRWGGWHGNATH
jgi:hypothetical protein